MSVTGSLRRPCPRCHTLESPDASLCRVCYEPLSRELLLPLRLESGGKPLHFRRSPCPPENWFGGFVLAATACLISSGWWKGKARYAAVGTAASFGLGSVLIEKWLERESTRLQNDPRDPASPVRQIPQTILRYALENSASQVRLTLQGQGVPVDHLVNGDWHTQMMLPRFMWAPLKNEFAVSAERGQLQCEHQGTSREVALKVIVEPPHQEIQLTVL